MSIWLKENRSALIQALVVFCLLFGMVIAMTIYFDFSNIDMGGLLFLTAFLCCVFIAKNTYDIAHASIERERLQKKVTVDLAVASEELYIKLYENSPVPYLIIDFDGNIKSANLASFRLLGIPQSKAVGINVFSRLHCETPDHLDMIKQKFHGDISVSDEMVQIKRSDNREAWALLSLFVFQNIMGEKIGLLTLVDITRQKKAEDAKAEFVSLASHQLRTPLAGMKWSAELLQLDGLENLNERQQRYIDRLLVSIRRMAVLIDDFLRVSRFELGTFKAEEQVLSLSDIFKDVMEDQSENVSKKKLVVKTFFEKPIDRIVSDPNLIRMIVTNLYSNAVKYTRESGTIHIGFGRKEDALIITVADNGMGIPVEDQDQIFTKLFRASNAVRDVPDGTGLGLYILREAVSVLRGNVSFTTTENVGTTFEVVLPLELPKED